MHQSRKIRLAPFVTLLLFTAIAFGQGTKITPPKNSYNPFDDVKLGKEAAAQVSEELPLLSENGAADNYVERVGAALAAAIPQEFQHSEFHYCFDVVNASDINAFALPGGPMFINRGMIEAAHNEGEMAGVMAHEISHVALRHATAQGKYSREYETQADLLGAQIMARAGYDPMDLVRIFGTIEKRERSSGPNWLRSHLAPEHRQERISLEARHLKVTNSERRSQSPKFAQIQLSLKRMPPALTMSEIKKSGNTNPNAKGSASRHPHDFSNSNKC